MLLEGDIELGLLLLFDLRQGRSPVLLRAEPLVREVLRLEERGEDLLLLLLGGHWELGGYWLDWLRYMDALALVFVWEVPLDADVRKELEVGLSLVVADLGLDGRGEALGDPRAVALEGLRVVDVLEGFALDVEVE